MKIKKTTKLRSYSEQELSGTRFDRNIYRDTGIFIFKKALSEKIISKLQKIWKEYYEDLQKNGGRNIDNRNSVNFKDILPAELQNFYKTKDIKKIAKQIFGNNVGLYNTRVTFKEKKTNTEVFLHQDFCYHLGFPEKCSLFVPFFKCGEDEGGLTFHLGSHQYGFLGDAGQIDKSKFIKFQTLTPSLEPGDILVMNSLTWHESGPNISEKDRVLFDIIIQPSNDPSSVDLISGEWMTEFWIEQRKNTDFSVDELFINSRIKKLKEK